jgi:multiple sugar transport system permease protein
MANVTMPKHPARPTVRVIDPRRAAASALRVLALYVVLIGLSIFILAPLGWMLTAALKPRAVPIFTFPPEWFPTRYWNWSSFSDALFSSKQPFLQYVLNTFMLVGLNEIGNLLSVALVAYPFARLRFRGREALFK